MLFWDRQLPPTASMLAKLTQHERFSLIMKCIEDVRDTFDRNVLSTATDEARQFFKAAFELLASARDISEVSYSRAQKLLQETSWIVDAAPGVWDLAMSLTIVLQRSGKSLSVDEVLNAIGCAYQVVLHVEIMRHLDHDVFESEIEQLEKVNTSCVDCIERQLRYINQTSSLNPANPITS